MTTPSSILPDTHQTRRAIYVSPATVIGKHEWCCVVYRHTHYGACTDYHWRRLYPRSWARDLPSDRWRPEKDWPRYDSNDSDNGLPRRLRTLFERYRTQIEAALASGKGGAS